MRLPFDQVDNDERDYIRSFRRQKDFIKYGRLLYQEDPGSTEQQGRLLLQLLSSAFTIALEIE